MRAAASRSWGLVPASSVRRSAAALLPRRAGAETEPEWKLYEEGDPNNFDNWKGKVHTAFFFTILTSYSPCLSPFTPPPHICAIIVIDWGGG
jgi:hypothetical protein